MTPKEDNIFGPFSGCPLAPLEGVPTYKYMPKLNVYLNSCSSEVNCTLGCSKLGYLVLTAHPNIFNTHCGTAFVTPRNQGIHPVMPNPTPTALIFSELVRTHDPLVHLLKGYHTVNLAFKKVIGNLIPEKYYKSLLSRIIGFAKVTGPKILTRLITKYAELEDEDVQDIDSENEGAYFRRKTI